MNYELYLIILEQKTVNDLLKLVFWILKGYKKSVMTVKRKLVLVTKVEVILVISVTIKSIYLPFHILYSIQIKKHTWRSTCVHWLYEPEHY